MGIAVASVLVVEDEEGIARYIEEALEGYGYEVAGIVSSGREAVRRAGDEEPDIVLMDIRLEGEVDGIEAAEHIRERYSIPVVYLTAYSDDETLRRAKLTEPFGYILKPFQKRELYSSIEMALYRHREEEKARKRSRELERRVEQLEGGKSRFEDLIKRRKSYLIKEKRYARSLAIFSNLTKFNVEGLCLTTQHPNILKDSYDLEDLKAEFLWLSTSGRGNAVAPMDLTSIHSRISEFTRDKENSVVLFLGMEYIVTLNDFGKSLKFLNSITDIITVNSSRLIVSIDPDALESRELSLLEKSLIEVTDDDLIQVGLK